MALDLSSMSNGSMTDRMGLGQQGQGQLPSGFLQALTGYLQGQGGDNPQMGQLMAYLQQQQQPQGGGMVGVPGGPPGAVMPSAPPPQAPPPPVMAQPQSAPPPPPPQATPYGTMPIQSGRAIRPFGSSLSGGLMGARSAMGQYTPPPWMGRGGPPMTGGMQGPMFGQGQRQQFQQFGGNPSTQYGRF